MAGAAEAETDVQDSQIVQAEALVAITGVPIRLTRPSKFQRESVLVTQSDIIAVQLSGGLGNQLFQYAAGRAASLRNNCRLALDLEGLRASGEEQIWRQYMLDVMKIEAFVDDAMCYEKLLDYNEQRYCFDAEFISIPPGTRLIGYFQSEMYFAPYRDRLRRELQLSVPVSAAFSGLVEKINSAEYPVSIHLRRGDFANNPNTKAFHGICGRDYYYKAMKIVEGLSGSRPTYFVFSDNRSEAMDMFGDLASVVPAETPIDRPWEDMFLMARCRDNILANSSLSWWASWLNSHPAKNMIAPRHWVSPETMRSLNTCDLYLEGTIII